MFKGEYNHSIDDKGRVILPAKLRENLGERVVISRGLDPCLMSIQLRAGIHLPQSLTLFRS